MLTDFHTPIKTIPTRFPISNVAIFKHRALAWADQFDTLCYLDNNEYQHNKYQSYNTLIAVDAVRELTVESTGKNAFEQLKNCIKDKKSWLFGFLTYDLKNDVEKLQSDNFDGINFPALHFFEPRYLIDIQKDSVIIHSNENNIKEVFNQIQNTAIDEHLNRNSSIEVQARISKNNYLKKVEKIRQHIIEGDLYEMNLCQEFYAENANIHPVSLFTRLNDLAKAPFASFYKKNNRYLLCASPERFLKKEGQQLISQPIKGTIKRGKNAEEDAQLQETLRRSDKDKAENVMIVDLVRNDLTRSSKTGTIKVEELFGIYPFEQVHHIISTVTSTLLDDVHAVDAIRHAFPMGSMTGAPKVMSMQLIEHYEQTRRGLYSGAVGYFTPEGDFDFNVVIRSILYNTISQYLSFQVGGAIVYDSVPEKEYEECLLKAKAMLEVLRNE